jgi:hypothetical protein
MLNTVLGTLLPMCVTFVLGFIALVALGKLSTVGNLMGLSASYWAASEVTLMAQS